MGRRVDKTYLGMERRGGGGEKGASLGNNRIGTYKFRPMTGKREEERGSGVRVGFEERGERKGHVLSKEKKKKETGRKVAQGE